MRILFPTLARFPGPGASVIQVANMAQAFAELGHDVRLVAPAGPEGDGPADPADLAERFGFAPGFEVVTLSRRIHRGQSVLHAARIARMAARGTDLVFSRNLRACLAPALRGLPTVFEAHTVTSMVRPQDRAVLSRLQRARGFRGVVAISRALADDLVAQLDVDPDRILVAHDAVRPEVEAAAEALPEVADGSVRVVYTGGLFPGKGAELIPAIAIRCPTLTFHVAGGPPEAADRLREDAERVGATNVVVHGRIDPAAARRLQRSCDILIAPFARRVLSVSGDDIARWTSPLKVFEYLASGRPMVVSDLPVLREVLRPDVDALMAPPEDVDAFAAAVLRLADDPGLRERLAASALERVHREFTWDLRARRILERFVPERVR